MDAAFISNKGEKIMCKNENCKCIPMMMCFCGGCTNEGAGGENGGTGVKETVLFEGTLNAVGSYELTDNINNYDDVIVAHEYYAGYSRQIFNSPISCLSDSIMICHGNVGIDDHISFKIVDNTITILTVNNSRKIVKIVGRKF